MDTKDVMLLLAQYAGLISPNDVQSFYLMEMVDNVRRVKIAVDQITIKEIWASFDAIEDAMLTANAETRKNRLHFSENGLLNNVRLDIDGHTGKYSNHQLVAYSHHGLAYIASLRNDMEIAVRHLMKSYVASPDLARRSLTPNVFESFFKNYCDDIYRVSQAELESISQKSYKGWIMARRIGTVTTGTVIMIFSGGRAYPATKAMIKTGWEVSSNIEGLKESDRKEVLLKTEMLLDERCRKIAQSYLDGKLEYPPPHTSQ